MNNSDCPRIYVACLAAYNAGELHGEWIDATIGVEEIRERIEAMLRRSPEPRPGDYAIHDFEDFAGLELREHEDLEQVTRAAQLIAEHGEKAALIIGYYGGVGELEEAEEALQDRFAGVFEDREAWAAELLEDTGTLSQVPESLQSYIDLERYARDMELSGDFVVLEGGQDGGQRIFVFWAH